VPSRDGFHFKTTTLHFGADAVSQSKYSVILGYPGELAEEIRAMYNQLIVDDVQVVPSGQIGLSPDTIVIRPGNTNINEIGAKTVVYTQPCNGAPNPATCTNHLSNGVIVVGSSGIAETTVAVTEYDINLTSGWRNPQRNEAWAGAINSRHQYGDAVDLQPLDDVPNKEIGDLNCILVTAAQRVVGAGGKAIVENGAIFDPNMACNDDNVDHIHANR
jgi:hypothetical protein